MRFGIVPLEFGPAVERIVSGGVPDFSRFSVTDAVRDAMNMEHISVIELTMDIEHVIPGALTTTTIDALNLLRDELGCSFTAHLPLWSTEPSSFNEHIREASVESTVSSIKLAEPLEPETYVFHSTGALAAEFSRLNLPKNIRMLICGYMATHAARSIEEIVTRTEIDPRRLALENVEFPFEVTRLIVDEYNTSICFDTGHLLTHYSGTESVCDFYTANRDRIREIHLHDGSCREREGLVEHRDHIALGLGELPIREFFTKLLRDKYNGPLVFELTADEARASLEAIRSVVPEVFQLTGH
ncbi:MAG: sugar phosphate isomerase/epimerase [Candidatus Thorarchaeota archaeon]|nr:sugar phosphate isomerase/epimerase [Candidatus Thorarchaeota archaeon]